MVIFGLLLAVYRSPRDDKPTSKSENAEAFLKLYQLPEG